jgi:hypothetical protein
VIAIINRDLVLSRTVARQLLGGGDSACVGERTLTLRKIVGLLLLLTGVAGVAMASAVPEVDAGSAVSALALGSGALLVIGGRRRKR